jgi:RNA polymerase sigma factor (sigma-70 family)
VIIRLPLRSTAAVCRGKDEVAGPEAGRRRSDADEDLLRLYLDDIGRHPLLTKGDEVGLARRIEAGSEAKAALRSAPVRAARRRELERIARDGDDATRAFVNANLRLVVSIAKRYQGSGLPLLDLIQDGNLGLIHAVEKFDWRKGFKFSTYATWWIRQAIQRGVANSSRTIRVPAHTADREAHVLRTETRSLSEPLGENSDTEFGDMLADARATEPFFAAAAALLQADIDRLLAPLDERERDFLRLRFGLDRGEPRQLDELAEHLKLSRYETVRLEARALSKLRHPCGGNRLYALLSAQ